MSKDFCSLHTHTSYSVLDGASKIPELVSRANELNMSSLGISDHGSLMGLVEFYKECKKQDIKPILGSEFYAADDRLKHETVKIEGHGDIDGSDKRYYHLSVYAENQNGYKNLLKLSSDAYLNGMFYKPRTDWEVLEQHSKGLIVGSGCLGGPVLQHLLHGNFQGALATAKMLQDCVGKDNFFIELMDHGLPEQKQTNPQLLEIAKIIGAKAYVSQDSHYTRQSDSHGHDCLLCSQTGSKLTDKNRFRFDGSEYYLKSPQQMYDLFDWMPELCDNTLLIAERCNVTIDFDTMHLPQFQVPEGFESDHEFLRHLAWENVHTRYPEITAEVHDRINYELSVYESMNVSSYMLIFWDLIQFATRQGMFTTSGRGSACGSIVSYILGVTNVDPLQYDLIFERFLNPSRISMPDIDWDIPVDSREMMINYVTEKYGRDHVAQIITFGTIKARTAVRDATRILGLEPKVGDRISKMMPPLISGRDTPLDECFIQSPKNEEGYIAAEELRQDYQINPETREIVDTARFLEGQIRSTGLHAAAIIVGDSRLDELVPLWKTKDGVVASQWEKNTVEDLGLVKMDFLGLKNLDIISNTERLIGNGFSVKDQPMDDPDVYAMLSRGETLGLFQVESQGMQSLLKRMRPSDMNDISAALALYRPGPMAMDWHTAYADRKNHREAAVPLHESLVDVLDDTYQLPIYQEQLMRTAQIVAGYSMAEADTLRKVIGKKAVDAMAAQEEQFVQGCVLQGYGEQIGRELFHMIEGFSGYGFNKCLTGDTTVERASGNQYSPRTVSIGELYEKLQDRKSSWSQKFRDPKRGLKILALDDDGRIRPQRVKDVVFNGNKPVWRITLADGKSITSTSNHRHMTTVGWKETSEIGVGEELLVNDCLDDVKSYYRYNYRLNNDMPQLSGAVNGAFGESNYSYAGGGHVALEEWTKNIDEWVCSNSECSPGSKRIERAHLDGDRTNNDPSNLSLMCASCHKSHDYKFNNRKRKWEVGYSVSSSEVVSIEYVGIQPTYDLEMDFEGHNFVANGIVTHNSHSVAYAFITYWTAYLKCHYPREYMASLLTYSMDDLDKTARYIGEARRLGLKVYPPHVSSPTVEYTVEPDGVRIGLNTLKGVGRDSILKIIEEGSSEPFTSLDDFLRRVNPNKTVVVALANAGALDGWGTRRGIATVAADVLAQVRKYAKKTAGMDSLFALDSYVNFDIPNIEYSWFELLDHEKKVMGVYASGHPMDNIPWDGISVAELLELPEESKDTVCGIVTELDVRTTKAGVRMAHMTLEDTSGAVTVTVFPKSWQEFSHVIQLGSILEVSVRVGHDSFREQKGYYLMSASTVDTDIPIEQGSLFGIHLPRGFKSSPQRMSRLKGVLLEEKGSTPVQVYISRSTQVSGFEDYAVQVSDTLKERLKQLFELKN